MKCQTCGGKIKGGDNHVARLPSPVSSFHHFWHLACWENGTLRRFAKALVEGDEAFTADEWRDLLAEAEQINPIPTDQ